MRSFNVKKGYAFINRNDTRESTFVHKTAITRYSPYKAMRSVREGETVEFDIVVGELGREPANVTGLDGNQCKPPPRNGAVSGATGSPSELSIVRNQQVVGTTTPRVLRRCTSRYRISARHLQVGPFHDATTGVTEKFLKNCHHPKSTHANTRTTGSITAPGTMRGHQSGSISRIIERVTAKLGAIRSRGTAWACAQSVNPG